MNKQWDVKVKDVGQNQLGSGHNTVAQDGQEVFNPRRAIVDYEYAVGLRGAPDPSLKNIVKMCCSQPPLRKIYIS